MKRISTYIATLVLALAGSSCSDYLDKEYDASLSEKKVFNNQNLTREFLANIYTNLPDGLAPLSDDQFTGASRDCMTDNAVTCWGLHYYTKIGSDGYTAGDHPLLGFWNTDLYGIRKCNMFLKNAKASVVGNTVKDGDDNRLYDRYCAEARLLRAIFHFDLICWFGAAPVIAEDESGEPIIFDLSDPSAMNMSRTPAAEALEWVADQCDQIKNQLPFRYSDEASNWGRVNGAAAYALKARALLYRASKLNNPDGNTAYWANAAQAAADFITQNNKQSYPYRLYNTGNPENDYYECFTTNPVYNNEIILARSVWNTNQVEKVFLPVGFTGSFSYVNNDMMYMMRSQMKLTEVDLPQKENEILVSKIWLSKYYPSAGVGDTVTLDISSFPGDYTISGIVDAPADDSKNLYSFMISKAALQQLDGYKTDGYFAYVHLKNAETMPEETSKAFFTQIAEKRT